VGSKKNVGYFFAHLIGSWLGVPFAGAPFFAFAVVASIHQFYPAVNFRVAHWILTETPFFPVQILLGLSSGFLLGRRLMHRVMRWTWTVPALSLVLAIVLAPVFQRPISGPTFTRLGYFFGPGCLPQNHCLDQLVVTMPFYAAVAYSLGAVVARMTRGRPEGTPSVTNPAY
jgi:hypothetical protein